MSPEELLAREAIRHTLACYTMAGDRLQVDGFVAVFTEDAVLETEGVPEADAFRCVGRAQIRAWMERWRGQATAAGPGVHQARFVRHQLSTCLIEFTGEDTAKVRTYWTAYTDIGADHCGYYLDAFRREHGQWLIARRRIRLDWRSEQSRMFGSIDRTRG